MFKFILNWLIKKYGKCVFGHKNVTILEASYSNCVYQCKECGKIFMAH